MKKKRFATLALVFSLLFAAVIPVSAAPEEGTALEVLKGTPAVDGVVDEIYKQSAAVELENYNFYPWGTGAKGQATATAYYLWDENYFYFAADVQDKTSASLADKSGDNAWMNDAAEFFFKDEGLTYKLHIAADTNFFLGTDGDGKTPWDFSKAISTATKVDGGYMVEVAIPLNNLAAGRELEAALQVNDIVSATAKDGSASGGVYHKLALTDNAVALPVLKGTPAVDGVVDEIYKQSAAVELENYNFYPWGTGAKGQATATAYYLWDENYFYFAADVKDKTSASLADKSGDNAWMNDAAEFFFKDEGLTYKLHIAADTNFFLGTDGDGKTPWDFSKAISTATKVDGGYMVEVAIPLNNLAAGRELEAALQVNDIISATAKDGSASGGVYKSLVLTDNAVALPVLKGTPAVDGVVDEIYKQSAAVELENYNFYPWGTGAKGQATATAYYLWDENYFYFAAEVQDKTSASLADKSGDNAWMNDAAEFFFKDEGLTYKLHIAADTNFFLGTDGDGKTPWDFSKAISTATKVDGGYMVEVAIPLNNLTAGRELEAALQVNDIISATAKDGSASGGVYKSLVLAANEVVAPEEPVTPEQPAEDETQQPAEDETQQPAEPTAPVETPEEPAEEKNNTVVIVVVAVVVVAAAAAGVVYSKKKKK